jgi:hypothetical protein
MRAIRSGNCGVGALGELGGNCVREGRLHISDSEDNMRCGIQR